MCVCVFLCKLVSVTGCVILIPPINFYYPVYCSPCLSSNTSLPPPLLSLHNTPLLTLSLPSTHYHTHRPNCPHDRRTCSLPQATRVSRRTNQREAGIVVERKSPAARNTTYTNKARRRVLYKAGPRAGKEFESNEGNACVYVWCVFVNHIFERFL